MTLRRLVVMLAIAWSVQIAAADEPRGNTSRENASSREAESKASATITRADLAAAYLRLERAYFAQPPTEPSQIAAANQAFDRATQAFFLGDNARAIRTINEITASLAPEAQTALTTLAAFKVTFDPPVLVLDDHASVRANVRRIYETAPSAEIASLALRLRDSGGGVALEQTFDPRALDTNTAESNIDLSGAAERLAAGSYAVEIAAGGAAVNIGRWAVVARSLDLVHDDYEVQLATITPSTPQLAQALAACKARNNLLSDHPSDASSAQFLFDPTALAKQVGAEIESLLAERDPYVGRTGDYWRVLAAGEKEIPLRVYAPLIAAEKSPLPLLIALHGAGADENMFLEGYGAGRIKRLADEHGLLIASPSTNSFGAKPEVLDALLEALAYNYELDRSRVFCLGHSMGAGASARLAKNAAERLAAACCIAGGGNLGTEKPLAPTLVLAAELDAIVPRAGLERGVQKAIDAGLPVELRLKQHYGHTLVVGMALGEAVEWLLGHRRS